MSPSGDETCSLIMKCCWTWLLFGQYLRSSVGNGSCCGSSIGGRFEAEGLQKEGLVEDEGLQKEGLQGRRAAKAFGCEGLQSCEGLQKEAAKAFRAPKAFRRRLRRPKVHPM